MITVPPRYTPTWHYSRLARHAAPTFVVVLQWVCNQMACRPVLRAPFLAIAAASAAAAAVIQPVLHLLPCQAPQLGSSSLGVCAHA